MAGSAAETAPAPGGAATAGSGPAGSGPTGGGPTGGGLAGRGPTGGRTGVARVGSNRTIASALYLIVLAVLARVVVDTPAGERLVWYAILAVLYLGLFSLLWWKPGLPSWALHSVFAGQSAIIFSLVALNADLDFIPTLFAPLAYQAALLIRGRGRWLWLLVFLILSAAPLMVFLGPLRGFALALLPMAGEVALTAFAVANQEIEATYAAGLALIRELEDQRERLREHVVHVEDLATVEERNRLARELHDSVSQTMFSILLTTTSAQVVRERDPDPANLRPHLEELDRLAGDALAQMRGVIAELRVERAGGSEGAMDHHISGTHTRLPDTPPTT